MSSLPNELKESLDAELAQFDRTLLKKATEALASRYREKEKREAIQKSGDRFMLTPLHRIAYVAARMPATYAVVKRVLEETQLRLPLVEFKSLLDLGAGPGTVSWAASALLTSLEKVTCVEQDPHLIELGKRFALHSRLPLLQQTNWLQEDIAHRQEWEAHDLIVLSYVIGEMTPDLLPDLVRRAWATARQAVVFIEPGTPYGFERILIARKELIDSGAYLAAPCPHGEECPLKGSQDWCHFAERVERSRLHRQLKEAELGYEDEKYSYVVGARSMPEAIQARILRHPRKHSGHLEVVLCTKEGVKERTISRRDRDVYKSFRKKEWGEAIPPC